MAEKERPKGGNWARGTDAAYIEPKFVPDLSLLPRDDSGGLDYEPHTGGFGAGGDIIGPKAYLSAGSGQGGSGLQKNASKQKGIPEGARD